MDIEENKNSTFIKYNVDCTTHVLENISNNNNTVPNRVKYWEKLLQKKTNIMKGSKKLNVLTYNSLPKIETHKEMSHDTSLEFKSKLKEEESQRFAYATDFVSQMKTKYDKEITHENEDVLTIDKENEDHSQKKISSKLLIKNSNFRNCVLLRSKQSGCSFWVPYCGLIPNDANPCYVFDNGLTKNVISKFEQASNKEINTLSLTHHGLASSSLQNSDIPNVLPFCEKDQFLKCDLRRKKFYHSVEIAKSALVRATEIDNFIVEKIWKMFDNDYGPNWIQDVIILVAALDMQ